VRPTSSPRSAAHDPSQEIEHDLRQITHEQHPYTTAACLELAHLTRLLSASSTMARSQVVEPSARPSGPSHRSSPAPSATASTSIVSESMV
jgi:hypothetical protein